MFFRLSIDRIEQGDLGWLLHKRPPAAQQFDVPRATATLMWGTGAEVTLRLDPDLDALSPPYVSPRAYRAGEELSLAIGKVFGSALRGETERSDLLVPRPTRIQVASVRLGNWIDRCFSSLGWEYDVQDVVGEWGTLHLEHPSIQLSEALSHIRVGLCLDGLDGWVDRGRLESWTSNAWFAEHPHRPWMLRRLAKGQRSLYDRPVERLHHQRGRWLVDAVTATGARSVVDAGCGRGELLEALRERGVEGIGLEASAGLAERASRVVPTIVGSIDWFDSRLAGRDAWLLSEVIEHVDQDRVNVWRRSVIERYRPAAVVLSTPNSGYNPVYGIEGYRHRDHRWEWNRDEWLAWLDEWHAAGWGSISGGIGEEALLERAERPSFWAVLIRPDWRLPELVGDETVSIDGRVEPGSERLVGSESSR